MSQAPEVTLALRRILASALENTAEVADFLGSRLGDSILTIAVELMPPKPPRQRKKPPQDSAEKVELPWWGRVRW